LGVGLDVAEDLCDIEARACFVRGAEGVAKARFDVVTLNIAEGSYARGRNRKALYNVALGSAKEVRACLDVARAFHYLGAIDESIGAQLNVICAVLYRLTR